MTSFDQTTTTPPPECQHLNFHCNAEVNRREDPHKETTYTLTVRTVCKDCGMQFYFWTPNGSYEVVRFMLKPAPLADFQAPPNM